MCANVLACVFSWRHGLHSADAGQAPGGGVELVNEIAFDGIGRDEGIVVAEAEVFEFMDAFVREEDNVASGEIVAVAVLGVFGPCDFARLIFDASICLSVGMSYSGSSVPCVRLGDLVSIFIDNKRRL